MFYSNYKKSSFCTRCKYFLLCKISIFYTCCFQWRAISVNSGQFCQTALYKKNSKEKKIKKNSSIFTSLSVCLYVGLCDCLWATWRSQFSFEKMVFSFMDPLRIFKHFVFFIIVLSYVIMPKYCILGFFRGILIFAVSRSHPHPRKIKNREVWESQEYW